MRYKFCATGDLMLLEKFSESYPDYDFSAITKNIKDCDVKITNLESVVSDWDCCASTYCGGQWINSEKKNLDDIEKFGFDFYSCANNHSMDFSYDGILSTIKELKKRKWKYAGIGKSLDEANRPAIIEKGGKKTALLSITSTFIDAARAGNGKDEIPPRPGINPLRVQTKYLVSEKHFEELKEIADLTYINGERDNARKIGSLPPEVEGSINFGGIFFCKTDSVEGKLTCCNATDLQRMEETVRNAKKLNDYVVVCVHSHQIKKNEYYEPDYFLEEFSHAMIDAGADIVFGGGTHQLKPIELYNGKPIFYSLGNFVFQNHLVKKLPADFWDKYQYPENLTVKEAMNIKTKNGKIGLETDINNYLSIIPVVEFDNDSIKSIELIPIELNFGKECHLKGLPRLTNDNEFLLIYNRLIEISSEYGTKMEVKNGRISVNI